MSLTTRSHITTLPLPVAERLDVRGQTRHPLFGDKPDGTNQTGQTRHPLFGADKPDTHFLADKPDTHFLEECERDKPDTHFLDGDKPDKPDTHFLEECGDKPDPHFLEEWDKPEGTNQTPTFWSEARFAINESLEAPRPAASRQSHNPASDATAGIRGVNLFNSFNERRDKPDTHFLE